MLLLYNMRSIHQEIISTLKNVLKIVQDNWITFLEVRIYVSTGMAA